MRGDSMTKSLQEIQQENRRLIMQIVHSCNFDKKAGYELDKLFESITLSRVLLGLSFNDISQLKPELKFYNGFIITINNYAWDLTKPTLEEQSEETQRAIYELLGGENE
jgi:hypothetical protein